MKGNPVAVAISEHGLSVHHIYRDESDVQLFSFVIDDAVMAGEASGPSVAQPNLFGTSDAQSHDEAELNVGTGDGVDQNDWLPKDLTPEKHHEPEPWRVQNNPYFEA